MIHRIADDFQSIAASLKKLEHDKEGAVNTPAQANERLIRQIDEARERAKTPLQGRIPVVFELGRSSPTVLRDKKAKRASLLKG